MECQPSAWICHLSESFEKIRKILVVRSACLSPSYTSDKRFGKSRLLAIIGSPWPMTLVVIFLRVCLDLLSSNNLPPWGRPPLLSLSLLLPIGRYRERSVFLSSFVGCSTSWPLAMLILPMSSSPCCQDATPRARCLCAARYLEPVATRFLK